MLYTLIGNGNANHVEIIATLESLREAVAEPDEFWMMLRDPGAELSDTVKAIVRWLDDQAIYYEVVVWEGADVAPELKNADETHVARRTLDYLLKLTKHRIQPDEQAALLVLSDDLDADDDAFFAVERAGVEGFLVFDLGGQMLPIILDDEPVPVPEDVVENGAMTPEETAEYEAIKAGIESQSPPVPEPVPLQTTPAPLSYTQADLEPMTRDELKALVKTQGVHPTDMRSKASMIEALMAKLEEPSPQTWVGHAGQPVEPDGGRVTVTEPEPDIEGKDLLPEKPPYADHEAGALFGSPVVKTEPEPEHEYEISVKLPVHEGPLYSYLIQTNDIGSVIALLPIPDEKMPLITTLLAEE